jgi:hypothetical protein
MPRLSIATAARRLRSGNASAIIYPSFPHVIGHWDDKEDNNHRTQQHAYKFVVNNAATMRHPFALDRREFHSTSRNEILPFIAVGLLGVTTVYSYRALQQMDQDWEEYYDAVEEYKKETGIDIEKQAEVAAAFEKGTASSTKNNAVDDDMSNLFTGGTLAIDMGTSTIKLSHRQQINIQKKKVDPVVVVDREGYRSTPSLVWMGQDNDEGKVVGRLAQARSHDNKGGNIIHPRQALSNNDAMGVEATREIIHNAASNALDQIIGGGSGGKGGGGNSNSLFVLDSSMATRGSYNVRPVFTYPHPTGDNNGDENRYIECYRDAVNELTSPVGIASFVSEPVATVTGAEYFNLLPPKGSGESVMVIDVGGSSTSISLVNGDKEVLHSMQLEFGGDTFVDALVSHLIRTFDGFKYEPQSSSKPTLSDTAALQRLYEASTSAVHELSSKTRSEINIPYLTMDLESRQPKHLEVGMARAVVENEVENYISKSLVPALNNKKTNVLSQAFQSPSTLSALFSSVIMSMLEQTAHTPYNLRAILLVGGGSRIPLVRESLKSGVAVLAGDAYVNGAEGKRLIIPGGEMGDELNVIGAAISASGG